MSFQQGLSGLNATSKNLEVIGNNIANAGTYGAKSSRAEFADFYAAALNGSTVPSAGIGVQLAAVAQQFTQGSITATDNPLDIAINGRGFFQVTDGVSPTKYTRNGQFKLDREGFIVNNGGMKLLGYTADTGTGQIQPGLAVPIQLPTKGIEPHATEAVDLELNLDASKPITGAAADFDINDASTYNNATSLTAFDAKGQPVALTLYFQRESSYNETAGTTDIWNVYLSANGKNYLDASDTFTPLTQMTFKSDGSGLDTVSAGTVDANSGILNLADILIMSGPMDDGDSNAANDITPLNLVGANGTGIEFNFDIKQFATPFGVTDMKQDGFTAGQLVSVGIEDNGIVTARYSNGQTKSAGQIEIANFRNLQGLQPMGNNLWAYTFASGDPVTGVPGEGNLGVLQAGALEESNIDLTAELVNMITAQRAYQANAQTIKTQDQIQQTLVNLR